MNIPTVTADQKKNIPNRSFSEKHTLLAHDLIRQTVCTVYGCVLQSSGYVRVCAAVQWVRTGVCCSPVGTYGGVLQSSGTYGCVLQSRVRPQGCWQDHSLLPQRRVSGPARPQ